MPIRGHAELSSAEIKVNEYPLQLLQRISLSIFHCTVFTFALSCRYLPEILKYFLLKFDMKYAWMIEQTRRLKSKETRGSIRMYNFYIFFKLIAIYFICYTTHILGDFSSKSYFKQTNKLYFFYLRSAKLTNFKPKPILL